MWLPLDMWAVVGQDPHACAALLGVSRDLHRLAREQLRIPDAVEQLLLRDTCLQSDLTQALLLPPAAVRAFPHECRRRIRGMGEVHMFDARKAARELLMQYGGAKGYFERSLRRERARATRAARKADSIALSEQRLRCLLAGLEVLGIPFRSDSLLSREYVSNGRRDLGFVLTKMAHAHYLHEHTGGEYLRAVDEEVASIGERCGFHDGIYARAAREVQFSRRFALPASLPWLPLFATTRDAIDAALTAAA